MIGANFCQVLGQQLAIAANPLQVLAGFRIARFGQLGQGVGEQKAVARFIFGQAQAAGDGGGRLRQGGFGAADPGFVQQLVGDAAFFEHLHVTLGLLHLLLRAKQLQRAGAAPFELDAGVRPQLRQALAAVVGDAQHALFVDGVALGRAVVEHGAHPAQLKRAAIEANGQRRVLFKHPLDGLGRNARGPPRRGIAVRNLPCVGKAGVQRRAGIAVNDRDFSPRTGQVIRGGYADYACAEYDNFHFGGLQ